MYAHRDFVYLLISYISGRTSWYVYDLLCVLHSFFFPTICLHFCRRSLLYVLFSYPISLLPPFTSFVIKKNSGCADDGVCPRFNLKFFNYNPFNLSLHKSFNRWFCLRCRVFCSYNCIVKSYCIRLNAMMI